MRVKTWRIIDRGDVPDRVGTVAYTCVHCGREAMLPVVGLVLAQIDQGLVFDVGPHAMPPVIQCRRCGRVLTTRDEAVVSRVR